MCSLCRGRNRTLRRAKCPAGNPELVGWDWLDLGTSPVNPMLAVYTDPPLALHIHNRLGSETAQPTWTKQESNTLYQRFLGNGGVWCLLFTEVPKVGVVTSGSSLGALSHMVGSITSKSSLSLTQHPYPTLTKPLQSTGPIQLFIPGHLSIRNMSCLPTSNTTATCISFPHRMKWPECGCRGLMPEL